MLQIHNVKESRKMCDSDDSATLSKDGTCFICDEPVESNGVRLVLRRTPYSNVGLPMKIGQLIGENFMVVVGILDIMCSRCVSLIDQLDKLEVDALTVKNTLVSFMAAKYELNKNEICPDFDLLHNSETECEQLHDGINISDPTQSLDSGKIPLQCTAQASSNKSQKSILKCSNCLFCTTDNDSLLNHSLSCLKFSSQCLECGAQMIASNKVEDHPVKRPSFLSSCNCCPTITFDSEELYATHMAAHISSSNSCGICGFCDSDHTKLSNHVLSHGSSVYNCNKCTLAFDKKHDLDHHTESHMSCTNCTTYFSVSASEADQLMECTSLSLLKSNDFDSDGSNIEFHPCLNCGLTFLNKTLFSEHMKNHNEHRLEDQGNTSDSDAHEQVSKSEDVSVAGDCSIDDDLEELFEKLHADTTNSPLASNETHPLKRHFVNNYVSVHNKSAVISQNLNISIPLKEGSPFSTRSMILSEKETSEVPNPLIVPATCDQTSNEKIQDFLFQGDLDFSICPNVTSKKVLSHSELLSLHSLGLQASETFLNSTHQKTFIYISGNAESDCSPEGLVFHNATIDSNSGDIHLIPFAAHNAPSSILLESSDLEINAKESIKAENSEQDSLKRKQSLKDEEQDKANSSMKDMLSCDFCNFQSSIDLVMKKHLKLHQSDSYRKCSICNRVYASTRRLLTHLDLRHKSLGPISCPLCSESLENSDLLRGHITDSHPISKQNFSCCYCGEKFSTKKSCKSHEESHSELFKFQCGICLKKFSSEEDLGDHSKWDHGKAGQCRYCGKQIDKPKALRNHELRHMQESNHHECHVCLRVFKTKTGLRHHAASHTGQFKFCCDFCGRGFMSRMMLEEHRSCHTKEERYVCDVCGQKFTFQSTYWIHRKWHETPYPYKCSYCGRFFKHSSLLAVHKRKHTGERPYKCPHCPLTFPVSGTLKRHLILHTGVYPYNCEACKQGFTAKHKYSSHLTKVHGITELPTNSHPSNLSMAVPDLHNNPNNGIQEWGLGDIAFGEAEDMQVLHIPEENKHENSVSLVRDSPLSSRVVEIVLDDSFQAVASVTLADVSGNQSAASDSWYD